MGKPGGGAAGSREGTDPQPSSLGQQPFDHEKLFNLLGPVYFHFQMCNASSSVPGTEEVFKKQCFYPLLLGKYSFYPPASSPAPHGRPIRYLEFKTPQTKFLTVPQDLFVLLSSPSHKCHLTLPATLGASSTPISLLLTSNQQNIPAIRPLEGAPIR